MRIYLLAISLIISTVGCLTVQGQDSLAYKREISYNILPFLRDPGSANFGFLLRLQQKNDQAVRLGLGFELNSNSLTRSKSFGQAGEVAIGYEWQKNKNKFVFYYGPEIRGYFGNSKSENKYFDSNSDLSKQTFDTQSYRAAAAGFFGVRCFIIPQLSIAVESGLQYAYSYSQNTTKSYYFNSSVNESTYDVHQHTINFIPIRAIYVGYHF